MKKEEVIKKINPMFLKGIAHRGLHNDKLTENGLKAFKNAIDHNLAFELDIHLTKDNQLLVCHDSELKRTCGKSGIIEDLTLKEIKENYRLLDGEEVPTFQEVLDLDKEKSPIVVELKVYKGNFKALAKKAIEGLKDIKDKKNILIISFDPRALLHMKKAGFVRQFLITPDTPHEWTYHLRNMFESVDLDIKFMKEKRVQKYSKKHFINVWTIDSKEKLEEAYPYCDTVTFQLMDENYVTKRMSEKNRL